MLKYTLEEAKHIWVTSDTHFNHVNIIKYCNRPFSSVKEMNGIIINNWNNVVSDNDVVYHLGDFALGDKSLIPNILKQLKGRKRLVLGNHDNINVMQDLFMSEYFESLGLEDIIRVGKTHIIMNHYPFASLPDSSTNVPIIQLFGHVHSSPYKQWEGLVNQYDIGVDNNNFTPVNLYEVIKKVKENGNTRVHK